MTICAFVCRLFLFFFVSIYGIIQGMNEWNCIIKKSLNKNLITLVISNPNQKSEEIKKIKARPIILKEKLLFQVEEFKGTQVFHHNFNVEKIYTYLLDKIKLYKQMQIVTTEVAYHGLMSKKGQVTIKKKEMQQEKREQAHNRKKEYLLLEEERIPFLVDLGVMTNEGKIVSSRFNKFKQINRFLEFIRDILPSLYKDREIRIIDFGCGKSYLTFAIYYYLTDKLGYDVRMTGLDLKEDVISHCSMLARKYGYKKLDFQKGDIRDYNARGEVDMVVTLHACDTATDYALKKAVDWNARVILSVPCCQHEVNTQISCDTLQPVLKYGLLKERVSALVTDALRGDYLEAAGYGCQILEFIDMEHTPKNILIRATRNEKQTEMDKKAREKLKELEAFLNIEPTISRLLK